MTFMKPSIHLIAAAAALVSASFSHAGSWQEAKAHDRSTLTYSDDVCTVTFSCDPTSEKDMEGTLGFDLGVKGAGESARFPFSEFEGPDAAASPVVTVTITRQAGAPLEFTAEASGSFSDESTFTFGVAEVSKKAKSVPRSILEALAEPGADSLRLVVADPRPSGKSLQFTIPVAGRGEEFQKLIACLK